MVEALANLNDVGLSDAFVCAFTYLPVGTDACGLYGTTEDAMHP